MRSTMLTPMVVGGACGFSHGNPIHRRRSLGSGSSASYAGARHAISIASDSNRLRGQEEQHLGRCGLLIVG